jgi:hypothetical protein
LGGLPFATSVGSDDELSGVASGASFESSFRERFLAAFGDGSGVGEALPVLADWWDELCPLEDE